MTKNFGQQFDNMPVKGSVLESKRGRTLISVAFDLVFPTVIVAVALAIGHLFFKI